MRFSILSACLVSCLFAVSASAADCEFNVGLWPALTATVKNSLGTYSCRYQGKQGSWWGYRCTLAAQNPGVEPLSRKGTLSVNPDAPHSLQGQFYAHGTFDEACQFNPELQ